MARMSPTRVEPDDTVEIAARLTTLRDAKKLSQAEIAKLVGATPQAWNNWERAVARIPVEKAIELVRVFSVTLDWIYLGDAQMTQTLATGGVAARDPGETPETVARLAALDAEVAGLREMLRRADRQADDLRAERDGWRAQAEASQRLLVDQRDRRPWWRRLAG
jgi:transcriptional regulator with XRE-family HTH domain